MTRGQQEDFVQTAERAIASVTGEADMSRWEGNYIETHEYMQLDDDLLSRIEELRRDRILWIYGVGA
ncbi:hypothetical protein [Devosia pacifica]|nr:hypothetical protein [Devosia pacifica]